MPFPALSCKLIGMTRSPAIPIVIYVVLAILLVPVFPHFPSPNELTRWALAAAIVEDPTAIIRWW